jgi:tetratricopeptide (TPR) repeat protein
MLKVIILFDSLEEKNLFLKELFKFNEIFKGKKLRKPERKKVENGINSFLTSIEYPRKANPYYKLYSKFYKGNLNNVDYEIKPWTPAGIFSNGIRNIYMLKSYKCIKGYWLYIEFRNNKIGREKYQWALENVPQDKLGENITVPKEVILKKNLKLASELLAKDSPYKHAERIYYLLLEVKEKMPKLFTEKYIFLWEELALVFDTMDLLDKAILCQKHLSDLMPNSSYPYLNMGVFYSSRGLNSEAIDCYRKGLEFNPNDEYIYYNLSSLLLIEGKQKTALKSINEAILENPERGINYKLKGDIHFSKHQYHLAITSYEWALKLFGDKWQDEAESCKYLLSEAYWRIGNKEKADEIKKSLKKDNLIDTSIHYGKLYYETGELKYEGYIKDDLPYGNGIKYFKNGQKEMEGYFNGWFVEYGKEYYQNGNLKFEGEYNSGPKNYYGPRYYVKGKLYFETGQLWYEGSFKVEHVGSIRWPLVKFPDCFYEGIEYNKNGDIVKVYKK